MLSNLLLSGKDTTLYKIVTSPVSVRIITKVNGKVVVSRHDGVFEFDGENFIKTNIKEKNLKITHNPNLDWAKLINPRLNYAQVELSSDGIFWVLFKNRFIYGFKVMDKIKRSFPEHAVRGIFSDGKTQLVSTYKGFYLNSKPIYKDSLLYSNSNIIEENGYFYFVANSEMIYKMKMDGTELEKIIDRKRLTGINNAAVLHFYKGALYIGGDKGLAKYNNNEIEIIQDGILIHNINVINDKFWVAADNGVYILKKDKLEKVFKVDNSTGVFTAGDMMVSTSYQGLWLFDAKKNRLENILAGSRHGKLETDAFYKDGYGNYWISTIDGILKYKVEDKIISTFLDGNEFNRRSYYFNGDTLFFGSNTNGLISFDVKELITEDANVSAENTTFRIFYIGSVILTVSLSLLLFFKIRTIKKNEVEELTTEIENNENLIFLKLEKYIKDHIDEVNVDQIRFKTGLTKYAFYNGFVKHFGKKPKAYLSEVKSLALKEKQVTRFKEKIKIE